MVASLLALTMMFSAVGCTPADGGDGGSDPGSQSQGTCTVTVNNANPDGGHVTGSGTYTNGESVLVTATPKAGYDFTGWYDGTGTKVSDNTMYSFTVSADKALTAKFELNSANTKYTITVQNSDEAKGSVSDGGEYTNGKSVTVTAIAKDGYKFVRWTDAAGAEVSTEASYRFTVSADATLVAVWAALETYVITTTTADAAAGTITGGGDCKEGSLVTLLARPNAGYAFVGWKVSGETVSTDLLYQFKATANKTVEAVFRKMQFTVEVMNMDENAGETAGEGVYAENASVTLTATPNSDYVFVGWKTAGGELISEAATYTFTATEDKTVVAHWQAKTKYTVTLTTSDEVAGTYEGMGAYNEGDTVRVKAVPNTGYAFLGWYDGETLKSAEAEYTFTAEANATLQAKWDKTAFSITVNNRDSAAGSVTGGGTYNKNAEVSLTATPNAGYVFAGWQVGNEIVSTEATYKFNATEDLRVYATWNATEYGVIKNIAAAGSISGPSTYEEGSEITVTATTNEGYEFEGWYVNDELQGTDSAFTFTVNSANRVEARWTRSSSATAITVTFVNDNEDAGYAEAYPEGEVNAGDLVELYAEANSGYEFAGWYNGETLISAETEYSYEVTASVTITAKWNKTRFTVTAVSDNPAAGSVVGSGNFNKNANATVQAVANSGYVFDGWYVETEKVSSEETYTFAVTADVTVTAKWVAETTATVTVTNDNTAAGTVTGGGSFVTGKKAMLTATANTGYAFDGWYVGTTKISDSVTYAYTVTENVTITAKWIQTSFVVTVVNDAAKGTVTGANTYDKDASATLRATANSDYRFAGWYVGGTKVSDSTTYTFTVTADVTVTAAWEEIVTYTVSVTLSDSAAGSVTGAGTYEENESVTLTAAANAGYQFVGWFEGETQLSTNATYTFTATADKTITAKYEVVQSGGNEGGGSGDEDDGSGTTGSGGSGDILLDPNTTVTLTAVVGESATEQGIVQAAAAGFKALYPGVSVNVVMASDIPYQATQGNADIVTCIGENVAEYVKKGALTSLDDYMLTSDFDTNAYYSSMMAMGTSPVDGKQYMMPRAYARIVCYYNKDIFDDYSVGYPNNDWTWDDYRAICQQFKSAGRTAVQITQAPMDYNILNWAVVSSFGVTNIMNSDWTVIGSDNAQYAGWKSGMEMAAKLVTDGYTLASKNYNASAFTTGMAAMAFMTTDAMADVVAAGLDFDVVSFPAIGSTPAVATGAVGYGIAPNSQNKDAAWAFLQYMMSSEGQATIARIGKGIPVLKSLAEDTSAEWRSSTTVTVDNMISYPERDVTASWFGALPADGRAAYGNLYNSFLANIVGNGYAFERAYQTFVADIADTKDEIGI